MLTQSLLQPVLQAPLSPPFALGGLSLTQRATALIRAMFAAGEQGIWLDPSDLPTMFQDSAGTTAVTAAAQQVGLVRDKSGSSIDALQATSAARPTYQITPARLTFDKSNDAYTFTIPAGGIVGTMVVSTPEGTVAYPCNIPAGAFTFGPKLPGSALVEFVARNGAMSSADINNTYNYCTNKGGGPAGTLAYGGVTNLSSAWYGWSFLTGPFPLIDTSQATNLNAAWYGCSSLTGPFPLIDTSKVINLGSAWYGCSSLTGPFPLIDTSQVTNLNGAWTACSSLTGPFPLINTSKVIGLPNTWNGCSSLTGPFPLIDVSKVIDVNHAWYGCLLLNGAFPALSFTSAVNGLGGGTGFDYTWFNCSSMTSFPANMFNACLTKRYSYAFYGCSSLDQASIENILVSIDAGGVTSGVLTMPAQATTALMTGTATAARASLISKGWTVTPAT